MTVRICSAVAAAALATAVNVPAAFGAKKGGSKRNRIADITKQLNAPIPDSAPDAGPDGLLRSTTRLGRRFRGRKIRDVNVTLQTAGVSGDTPGTDLQAYLSAPNGATAILFRNLGPPGAQPVPSIGPLTLDDESPLELASFTEPVDPTQLNMPWAGTAQPVSALFKMDNGRANGSWTLDVVDTPNGETSNLVFWRLQVITGRPYLTK